MAAYCFFPLPVFFVSTLFLIITVRCAMFNVRLAFAAASYSLFIQFSITPHHHHHRRRLRSRRHPLSVELFCISFYFLLFTMVVSFLCLVFTHLPRIISFFRRFNSRDCWCSHCTFHIATAKWSLFYFVLEKKRKKIQREEREKLKLIKCCKCSGRWMSLVGQDRKILIHTFYHLLSISLHKFTILFHFTRF